MEEVKAVVQTASDYLKGLIDEAVHVRLEQVEQLSTSEWSVVLSFPDDQQGFAKLMQDDPHYRVYKEILVNGLAMKPTALKVWKH